VLTGFTCGCGDDQSVAPPGPPHVIFIDIDDHGLAALWDANAPNLQRAAREGVLAFSRVDLPTHSNQNNITLLTGAWPEATNVPHNSWLDRAAGFMQPFSLFGGLSTGDYIYYDRNPLGRRVQSIYTSAKTAGVRSSYVGMLPPWEHGADDMHLTIYGAELMGLIKVTKDLAQTLLRQLRYPQDVIDAIQLDGPPAANESLNHFTLHDAATVYRKAKAGGPAPSPLMFVWTFVALDDDPTSTDGASGPGVRKIVEDIDAGVGDLMAAVAAAGYADRTSYVLTLDHGKVDTHNQVVFEKQLGDLITREGAAHGVAAADVKTLNEDGDVLIYAATDGAGTPAGTARQTAVAHGLVELVQSGQIMGVDPTRTITWDGYRGTRRFFDLRSSGPNNPDLIVFPQDDWTLGDVARSGQPGPIGRPAPFGRHGGVSADELYVPAIFWGPAFRRGALVAEPIDHADIAPTVMAAIGAKPPGNAQTGVLHALLAGDTSGAEIQMLPADVHTARDLVLRAAGFAGDAPRLTGMPAKGVVWMDVAGLYADAPPAGPNVTALAHQGVRFVGFFTRFRDFAVTEYQLLTGTYPIRMPWVPFAENDPMQTVPPGLGLFAMPPPPGFISDRVGYDGWHTGTDRYDDQSVFAAAKELGLYTAVLGSPDFHLRHLAQGSVDLSDTNATLAQVLSAHPSSFIFIAMDAGSDAAATAETVVGMTRQTLDSMGLAGQYVVALSSRGGAPIDAATADAYGPGSARHVPLILAGPNLRAGAVVASKVSPSDVAPTLLYALGVTARPPDVAWGVQLGPDPNGDPGPLPHGDLTGRVLLEAFAH
jgi:hypothetical protein